MPAEKPGGRAAIRLAVVESIGDMATTATLPTLTMALSDPNAQIRIAALDALALQDDTSLTGIIETLLYDSDRQVRLKAIDTLTGLGQGIAVY